MTGWGIGVTRLADIRAEEYRGKGYVVCRDETLDFCPASTRTWWREKVTR